MTPAALWLAGHFLTAKVAPSVVEYSEADARVAAIELVVRVPPLTDVQTAALGDLVRDLTRQVEGFTRRDEMLITNGDRIRTTVGPGYILVSYTVPPQNWRPGLALMAAIAKSSQLVPPELLTKPIFDAWQFALNPIAVAHAAPPDEKESLYRTLFRPGNMILAVGGAVPPGRVEEDWTARMGLWDVPRIAPPARFAQFPVAMTKNPGGLDSIDLSGPDFSANDAALPTRVLALIALGSGKGASLFRVARMRLTYSYRQEALLWPRPDGWQGRLLLVSRPAADLASRAEILRAALLDDVRQWTEASRTRALGMADAIFLRNVEFSPFAFGPGLGSLEGRTFLRAFWQMKTGSPWDAPAFLAAMRGVQVADLKACAEEFLREASPRTLPAG